MNNIGELMITLINDL